MTLEEAIAIMEDPEKHEMICSHDEMLSWLKELQELSLQQNAPRLGSIEEYHYELARCKTAFWSCNKRCMEAVEQYRRKVEELKTVQEQISEYKRILKAAVEDLRWVNENTQDAYGTCIMKKSEGCGDCPLDINGDLWCKWKHEAEALALIGEDGDPE